MTDGPGARLTELVERCEPLVGHLVGYGLAGHPDPGGAAGEVMRRARRDVQQIQDPAGVRARIAAEALWQVRRLRQPGHLGAPVDGLGLTDEARRVAEAARRLTPQDRDTFALFWLCVAGELTEAEAGLVLGAGDATYRGRGMPARLDAARTVLAALAADPACPGLLAVTASLGRSEFLAQSRHVADCPICARHGDALAPATEVLAAAGLVRLPGEARPATSPALLAPPQRPPASIAVPASAEVTALLPAVVESAEVTAVLPAVVESAEVTTLLPAVVESAEVTARLPAPVLSLTEAPEAPAGRRKTIDRRAWQFGLAALVVLIGGVVVANLSGTSDPGNPSPTATVRALAPTASASVADTGGPGTELPVDPPPAPATDPAGGDPDPATPGTGPASRPAGTTAPTTAPPAALFRDDFESGSVAGWSESGGSWSVVTDGRSRVLRQANPTPGLSRVFAGDPGWAGYSLRAQVKPLGFGWYGLVGVTARARDDATYYRLALTSDGRAVLEAYAGYRNVTTLATAFLNVAAGTWYTLRIDVSGSTVTGYVDGRRIGSGTSTLTGSGRIGLQTAMATAEFDNVIVTAAP